MKYLCLIIILFTSALTANAQIEYSVNAGGHGFDDVGFSIAIEGGKPIKEKFIINQSIQYSYSQFRWAFHWPPNYEIVFFNLYNFSYSRINLITELDYKLLSFVRIGAGIYTGIRVNQYAEGFSQQPFRIPKIPEESNINFLTIGVTAKVRIDIKRFYIQARYVHILNDTWTYNRFTSNGIYEQGARKDRPTYFLVGFTF